MLLDSLLIEMAVDEVLQEAAWWNKVREAVANRRRIVSSQGPEGRS